ncbi:MAG TPA: hypothetical protein VIG50_19935 [Vicinamibacteria bacterium]
MGDPPDPFNRAPWVEGPGGGEDPEGWLALTDDELLYRIEALPVDHARDYVLLAVVCSHRHFFIRQEAAKKMRDTSPLREHSGDRHIGQILVRSLNRKEDADYLWRLMTESRHLEVRKAAEAQLRELRRRLNLGE